jgi:TRAP-type mannitol/chloroaromatic compound transport system permease small subunit
MMFGFSWALALTPKQQQASSAYARKVILFDLIILIKDKYSCRCQDSIRKDIFYDAKIRLYPSVRDYCHSTIKMAGNEN